MKYSSEINKYDTVDYCVYSDNANQVATVDDAKYVMQFNTFEEGHNIHIVRAYAVTDLGLERPAIPSVILTVWRL